MKRLNVLYRCLVILLVLFLSACGSQGPEITARDNHTATVTVGLKRSLALISGDAADLAAVASITLTVSAPDMATTTASLPLSGETVAIDVPAGVKRVFTATARDAGGSATHTGSTTLAQLIAGTRVRVNLTLNPTGPDTTPPTVTNTVPASGATGVAVNSVISATFSEAMDAATINATNFQITYPDPFGTGGETVNVSGAVTYSAATYTATFTPDSDLPYSTQLTAVLGNAVQDAAGNGLAAPFSWTFTTGAAPDTTPPTVTSTNPADTATGVDPGTAITVTFSEAMDPTTINTSTLTVSGPTGAVTGTVGYSGTTATFSPDALAYGATYTVTVTTGAKDAAGNALGAAYVFSFTTQPPPDTTAPTVTSTDPADGATGVDPSTVITVTFSEDMDCTTLTNSTFTVTGAGSVSGTVGCSGSTATFTPDASFTGNTTYTAALTTGVKDLAGNPPGSDYTWSFTTLGTKAWGTEALIDNGLGTANVPKVAINASGAGAAVWVEWDGSGYTLYARRFSGGSWSGSVSELHPSSWGGDISYPTVAVDDAGNAMAMWINKSGSFYRVIASYYNAGTATWSDGLGIASSTDPKNDVQVAFDSVGNATAVWQRYRSDLSPKRYGIVSRRFSSGSWESTTFGIDDPAGGDAGIPQIAADGSGNAIVVWVQQKSWNRIFANRYTAGVGWGSAVAIDDNLYSAYAPQVAVDSSGNALAVWYQFDPDRKTIYATRYVSASDSWTSPELIDNNGAGFSNSDGPDVVVDGNGNGMAVWQQNDGTNRNIYARPYASGTWGTIDTLSTGTSSYSYLPVLAGNSSGSIIALWMENGPVTRDVWSRHYSGSWGAASAVETGDIEAVMSQGLPGVGMDGSGNAVAVWINYIAGPRYAIYANIYQ